VNHDVHRSDNKHRNKHLRIRVRASTFKSRSRSSFAGRFASCKKHGFFRSLVNWFLAQSGLVFSRPFRVRALKATRGSRREMKQPPLPRVLVCQHMTHVSLAVRDGIVEPASYRRSTVRDGNCSENSHPPRTKAVHLAVRNLAFSRCTLADEPSLRLFRGSASSDRREPTSESSATLIARPEIAPTRLDASDERWPSVSLGNHGSRGVETRHENGRTIVDSLVKLNRFDSSPRDRSDRLK